MMKDEIREILARPTCSVAEFGRVVGLSKNPAYDAVKRGDVPSLRFGGGRIRVVTAPLKAILELDRLPNTSAA